jgi:dTMP kinase
MDPQFIVVEGLDGVGTTSCSKGLVHMLNDRRIDAVWTKEPSDGPVGRHIRRVLKHQEAATELAMFPMFLADRHDHISSTIQPELEQGNWVVCDRYVPSTWVYQQDNYDPILIEQMHRHCLAPDWIFILHAPVEVCLQRRNDRDNVERYEVEEMQHVYAERYRRYGPDLPRIGHERIVHINNEHLSQEETLLEVISFLSEPR